MVILILTIGTLSTGCMGSWVVTKKVYKWNEKATGNKFVDNLIFWILGWIVYPITLFLDSVVSNLIEFWSGSNPMTMEPGEMEKEIVKGKDGNDYEMTVTQYRYDIVALSGNHKGEKTSLFYTPDTKTWSTTKDGITQPIATIHEDLNKVKIFTPDGSVKVFDINTLASQRFLNRSN